MNDTTKLGPAAQKIADGLNDAIEGRYQTTREARLEAVLRAIVEFNDSYAEEDGVGFDPRGPLMSAAREALACKEHRS